MFFLPWSPSFLLFDLRQVNWLLSASGSAPRSATVLRTSRETPTTRSFHLSLWQAGRQASALHMTPQPGSGRTNAVLTLSNPMVLAIVCGLVVQIHRVRGQSQGGGTMGAVASHLNGVHLFCNGLQSSRGSPWGGR